MKRNLVSIVIAVVLGGLAGLGHINSAYAAEKEVQVVKVINYETPTEDKTLVVYRDKDIPEEVQIAAEKYSEEYQISAEYLEAVAFYESSYHANAISPDKTCIGLMQIAPRWHKTRMEKLGVTDLYDADQNMHVAADYLAELFEKYEDPQVVAMEYNGDHSWKKGKLSNYSNKVMLMTEELTKKHLKEN